MSNVIEINQPFAKLFMVDRLQIQMYLVTEASFPKRKKKYAKASVGLCLMQNGLWWYGHAKLFWYFTLKTVTLNFLS